MKSLVTSHRIKAADNDRPSPESASSLSGTVINNSSYVLVFDPNDSNTTPSPTVLGANGGKTTWNDSGPTVYDVLNWTFQGQSTDAFSLSVYIPLVGGNQIGADAVRSLSVAMSGNTSGWNLALTWTLTDA